MKKKIMRITLHDGKVLERDLTHEKIAPIGAPANCQEYLQFCTYIAATGINDDATNENHMIIHTAASIHKIELIFQDPKP